MIETSTGLFGAPNVELLRAKNDWLTVVIISLVGASAFLFVVLLSVVSQRDEARVAAREALASAEDALNLAHQTCASQVTCRVDRWGDIECVRASASVQGAARLPVPRFSDRGGR